LADELKQAFGVESELIPDHGGIFDVLINGRKIYSKFETGRFPNQDEIVNLVKQKS